MSFWRCSVRATDPGRVFNPSLAGSFRFEDITILKRINPDIIGVRGMVCGGNRNATINEDLIATALAMIR
jgi:uncharacterized protein (UPF0264 family)